jgi:probable HAF family extracellular repeat protein
LGGTYSFGNAINNSDQIVGSSTIAGDGIKHAFLYSAGSMLDLGVLDGNESEAWGVNSSGQVVGNYENRQTNLTSRPFLYSNGTMHPLGTFGGEAAFVWAINDAGQIVGGVRDANGQDSAIIVTEGGGFIALGSMMQGSSNALANNSAGDVVGSLITGGMDHGFIYSGGVASPLLTLLDSSGAGITNLQARDINDSGQIVAIASRAGQTHAVLLDPVPEPTSLLAVALGGIGYLICRSRRGRAADSPTDNR